MLGIVMQKYNNNNNNDGTKSDKKVYANIRISEYTCKANKIHSRDLPNKFSGTFQKLAQVEFEIKLSYIFAIHVEPRWKVSNF